MVAITPKPFILQDATLTLGTDDYSAAVSTIQAVPNAPTANWKGLKKGSSFSAVGDPSWVVNLNFAQDWDTATTMARYLLNNIGKVVACTFAPRSGGTSFTCSVLIMPPPVGGDVDSVAVGTVSLPVQGALVAGAATPAP